MLKLAWKRRVMRVGESLAFSVPPEIASNIARQELYVYREGDTIVYDFNLPEKPIEYFKVKVRVQARRGDKEYCILVIPKRLAEVLGIKQHTPIEITVEDSRILVKPVQN